VIEIGTMGEWQSLRKVGFLKLFEQHEINVNE
jgi:hypothetical protein